jgi:high-affinity iron transporter
LQVFVISFSIGLPATILVHSSQQFRYEKHMKTSIQFIVALSLIAFSFFAHAQGESKATPEIVVHLLDYLAKDYGGAVQNGKVKSKGEYAEQIEFVEIVSKNTNGVESLKKNAEFVKGVSELEAIIKNKGSADEVAKLARKLQQDAITLAGIEVAPTMEPDLALGAKIYQSSCIACHGSSGHGDGPAGAALNPKPANFHDPDLIWTSAPFKFYNTIRLGVPGTGMVSFAGLSDHEVWSISYFLKSLPYAGAAEVKANDAISATDLATLTDEEIVQKLGGKSDSTMAVIGSLRARGGTGNSSDPLKVAESHLNESVAAAKSGDYSKAQTFALNAYLQGIEPLEPKMRANLPGYVEQIETLMSGFRSSVSAHESIQNLEAKKLEIFGKLSEARVQFSSAKMSPGVAFGAAFSIFLREGFEAVLIIIVLLSILRAMGQTEAVKWVHAGWLTALGLGVISWFASGILLQMSGLSRELLEGSISLLAVVVLIYVGFWLHRYTEMKKWRAFLEEKLRHGLSKGNYLGLAIVAFLAVFREAFEVVLFLRAIWIDLEPSGQSVAGLGVLSSFVVLIGLSYFAVKESKKLPLTKLFQICSWTMMALAIVLAGKGIHSLQEAGFISVATLPIPFRVDLLGIYPSYQSVCLQIVTIVLFGALLFSDRKHAH